MERIFRVTFTESARYTNGYPTLPGQRPDLVWNALRLAALQGLNLSAPYTIWVPAPDDPDGCEIHQDVSYVQERHTLWEE